ncbi:MAG: GNAT family N-acetyltransferase [Planctomycetota bacterium]
MDNDIVIARNEVVTDGEIALLRTAVGWDSCAGEYEKILPRLFAYFTARQNDALVGFVSVISDGVSDAFLGDLMVHPDCRRRGIGSALVKAAVRYVIDQGIRCTQVAFCPPEEPFFEQLGFYIMRAGVIDTKHNPPRF